ncbi:ABC-three component system protein [Priestia aryabhattai]|uniref:ABC-three component system protein n=1 Tax=Priestia aryabhattai TaxID=412384 RepID=UPI000C06F5CF|nr:ABC-three component system protein [Priestia aryabhattai]
MPTLLPGKLHSTKITSSIEFIQYLESCQGQMDVFITRFPSELQYILSKASSEVLSRLDSYEDDVINSLLDSYQFYRRELGSVPPGVSGWLDLWKILTLIQIARPDWHIKNVSHYSNFGINKSYYYILYSIYQDTMPEIILELVERFFESPLAYFTDRMFSRLLILENSLLLSEEQNLCYKCKTDNQDKKVKFDRIITNFGKSDIYDRWGISRNHVGDIQVVCFKCLQSTVLKSSTHTLTAELQGVI